MTMVQTADGGSFEIPTGALGTWPWAREASLIAVSYQQAGDLTNAYRWAREFERRNVAYNALQAGADYDDIIASTSWLDGPQQILAYLAQKAKDIFDAAADLPRAAVNLAQLLPWLVIGGLIVVGVGFSKGSLRLRR